MKRNLKFIFNQLKPRQLSLLWVILGQAMFVACRLVAPIIISKIVDGILKQPNIKGASQQIWLFGLLMIIVAIGEGVGAFVKSISGSKVGETFSKNTRDKLFSHIQFLPYQTLQKLKSGDLIQRATSDIDTIRRFLSVQINEFVHGVFTIIIALSVLLSIHPYLTLLSFITLPALIGFSYGYFKKVQKGFLAYDEADSQVNVVIQENIDATRVVKAFNQEKNELDKFIKVSKNHRTVLIDMLKHNGIYWGVSDGLALIQLAITLLFGIQFAADGQISVGEFIVFSSYISFILYPIRSMGRILGEFGKVGVALERLFEILDEPIEDVEKGVTPPIEGHILFKDVSFRYEDSEQDVLMDLNFEIKPHSTTAIMGPTGSGKSSLIHLLTKLYDYHGHIILDGVELKSIAAGYLRKNVGLVLQEPFLFSKTIEENIKISNPSISLHAVKQAAKIASVDSVIESFDQGYQTIVGEKGVTLSGGQKQRIAIARTVLGKSPIIIFDDSLSAVDTQTDKMIQEHLDSLKDKQTMIIITHRVSSAQNADQILVIDKGRIIESGTHQTLMENNGLYRQIADIQSSEKGDKYESAD